VTFKENLHLGLPDAFLKDADNYDIAASAQQLCENLIYNVMRRAMEFGWSNNLVYMGGVALNCSANRNLGDYFENIWIMPSPGDGGSSLGAAALAYGGRISWTNAFLGDSIPGEYPVNALLDVLFVIALLVLPAEKQSLGPELLATEVSLQTQEDQM
jgi:carbamoyltransferase